MYCKCIITFLTPHSTSSEYAHYKQKWCISCCLLFLCNNPKLPVSFDPSESFFSLISLSRIADFSAQGQVFPRDRVFCYKDTESDSGWKCVRQHELFCKLAVFTWSHMSVGGFMAYITLCCTEVNINKDSQTTPLKLVLLNPPITDSMRWKWLHICCTGTALKCLVTL